MLYEMFIGLGIFYLAFTLIIFIAQQLDENKNHRLEREFMVAAATEAEIVQLRSIQNFAEDV